MSTQSNKLGDVQKCPACGALVSRMSAKCPECGYEFTNISSNSTATALLNALQAVEFERISSEDKTLKKIQIIQNFPVPNTKEDLIEMITMSHANMESGAIDSRLREAWKAKNNQLIQKAQISLKGDHDAEQILNNIQAGKDQKSKRLKIILISAAAAIVVIIGVIIGVNASSKSETTNYNTQLADMKTNINKEIQTGDYEHAFAHLDSLNSFIMINQLPAEKFEETATDSYQKLVVALIREDEIEDAALVALDYREKLNDESKWKESSIFKVLVQECEVRNIDDSPLR